VVVAVDHPGNTIQDAVALAQRVAAGKDTPAQREARIQEWIADRVPDLCFLLDHLLSGAAGDVATRIDPHRIGIAGHSFGGWAALAAPAVERRIGAVVALALGG
jgi:predicted dienelactone hydrolase